jgi:hypothetical protein
MLQTPRMQEGSDDSMTLCLGHEGQAGEIFAFFGGSAGAVNCRLDDNRWRREGGRGCTHDARAGRNQVRIAQTSISRSKEVRAWLGSAGSLLSPPRTAAESPSSSRPPAAAKSATTSTYNLSDQRGLCNDFLTPVASGPLAAGYAFITSAFMAVLACYV